MQNRAVDSFKLLSTCMDANILLLSKLHGQVKIVKLIRYKPIEITSETENKELFVVDSNDLTINVGQLEGLFL